MKFTNRLIVFFCSYMFFVFLFFFTGQLWTIVVPALGLLFLAIGGFIHVRRHD